MNKSEQELAESPYFDISDFQGLTKFKIIIPVLYIASWVCMFAGPSLFQVQYQMFIVIILAYLFYKFLGILGTMVYATFKSFFIFRRIQKQQEAENYRDLTDITDQIYHTFIIPNYKQDVELLAQTLQVLASHKRAKTNYIIVLAMEAHEQGSQQKAYHLIQSFQQYFRAIDFTKHKIRKYEQKGKASNVSWCAQHLKLVFQKNLIHEDLVMLTIIDADSWAPDLYIDVLEENILQEYEQRHYRVYQPTQIFTRNNLQVPFITRVYDNFTAFLHMSSLYSCNDLTLPLSNYTLSYRLAKEIGFWDTCSQAIAEDMHTTLKAYWKTEGQIKGRPIFVPFNQTNISTGNGYWPDVKARFWQGERHGKAVAQIAYVLKMLLKAPFRLKNIHLTLLIFEIFAFVAIGPWAIGSLGFQQLVYSYYKHSPQMFDTYYLIQFFNILNIIGGISYFLYDFNKRKANRLIYKQQNESILHLFEYYICIGIVFVLMFIPALIISGFLTLFGENQYRVAQKKMRSRPQRN